MENRTGKKVDDEKRASMGIAKQILAAQQEIDHLAVQLSLGKADAIEKFEEIKEDFGSKVKELKRLFQESPDRLPPDIRQKIEELEVQLALGKAETKEKFATQKKRISAAINHLENELRIGMGQFRAPHYFMNEVEKFKLKMEILRLRMGLRKFVVKDEFRRSMTTAKTDIRKIFKGAKSTLRQGKEKVDDFSHEIAEAYSHLKKAVREL